MPANRNALIRYKTLDGCLSNQYKRWTLDDLIEACSDALYEFEGIIKGISRRTIQSDIQMMRSDKLGYNAPIEVYDRSYYRYSDLDYSITNMPLSKQDLDMLADAVRFLNQYRGFSHFRELNSMVKKIEDKVHSDLEDIDPIIEMDSNEQLKGLEYIDIIYQAVSEKKVVDILYQSFRVSQPVIISFHPFLLKEYNNRWFVVGRREGKEHVENLALDRITNITMNDSLSYFKNPEFSSKKHYEHTVGITVLNNQPEKIHLQIDKHNAPYILTKPLHHSQRTVIETEVGTEIELRLIVNYEFERLLLGFAEGIKVISPVHLRHRLEAKLQKAVNLYQTTV